MADAQNGAVVNFTLAKPLVANPQIVVSVPHSGTRTLVEHLGLRADEQGLRGGKWWHFGSHYNLLVENHYYAHIPIRNPYDVARSWCQRNTKLAKLLECYAHLFLFLDATPRYTLHRMEDLPRLRGTQEHIGAPIDSPQIREFQAQVARWVVAPRREFWRQFYHV